MDKRDELGSTRYDYRHARTQARILENVRRRQSGANYAVNYRPCMAYMLYGSITCFIPQHECLCPPAGATSCSSIRCAPTAHSVACP